jgi:photosystem II stability/assembly factor-like uncharacterized protein
MRFALWFCFAAQLFAQNNAEFSIRALKFREIGPAVMGGRVDDVAVVESDPRIAYVALAGGGLWKTVNAFTTWEPVFDDQPVSSIGAVAVAPSDPSIVWAGTGEANNRQSSSWGNGVYKSLDGGRTWLHVGLAGTQHIGRIVINPRDPNIVYIAAVGHLWGPNHERGVYKTIDGGQTWTTALYISDDTGATDIAIDRDSPDTIYAAMYERRRTAFGYDGGGPESGLYKTVDGGAHWTRLANGLPHGDLGRIGIDIYRHNTNIVYALIEHAQGGVFRSNDKGATWTRMGPTNPRPSYFSQIRVDPNNDLRVWVSGTSLMSSEDGGKTFRNSTLPTSNGIKGSMHEDFHAQWIDPANSEHMIAGNDGGMQTTWDGGAHWELHNNVAIGQFYGLSYDFKRPYNVCGGLQDNDSWCGPSRALIVRGISNDEWLKVGGGDGMYSQVDPEDPNFVYAEGQDGNITRRDLRTEQSRSIRPREQDETEPRFRFHWTTPFVISHFDSKTLYIGGNYVFRSTDRGDSWQKIGPDLTTGADRTKLSILGKIPDKDTLSRNDGVTSFPEITTLSESPVRAGILWAGTSDGNVQVTRDGKTWKNVVSNLPGVPKGTFVSRVLASRTGDGTAFVAFDGHRSDDFKPYLFLTTDFGEHWTDLTNGLPQNTGTVHVIVEHFRNTNLLFAGTELGLFVSFDRGQNWQEFKNNLPRVPIDDILIQPRENDLILGTHGRSIWILDDITPLEKLSAEILASDAHLFEIRPAVEWHLMDAKTAIGHAFFVAENPSFGALIQFYLKTKPERASALKIDVINADGKVVRTLANLPNEAGLNRTAWDLRTDSPAPPNSAAPGGGRGGAARGYLVPPGEYSVRLTLASASQTQKVLVEDDLRVQLSPEDRAERTKAITELFDMDKESGAAQRDLTALRTATNTLRETWKGSGSVPDAAAKALGDLDRAMEAIEKTPGLDLAAGSASDHYEPPPVSQRINRLLTTIDGYAMKPTADQTAEIAELRKEMTSVDAKIRKLIAEDLPRANKILNDAGVPFLSISDRPSAGAGRRRQ